MLKESGEFVINLTTEQLAKATDYCGVRSGKDVDKWKEAHLTPAKAEKLRYAPVIEECPVNIECKVTEVKELGSHHMFLAEVLAVQIDAVSYTHLDVYKRQQITFWGFPSITTVTSRISSCVIALQISSRKWLKSA